jgi:EAL domain-containing protein (putative c-di-GMP-specific phosphodiesterase class I)
MIKLRPGLAHAVASNSAQQDIIRGVVFVADSAGAGVIADGVQDAADLAVLWQCGVKLVSGEFLKESSQVVGQ